MNALYQLYSAEGELLDFTYFKEKDGQGYLTTLSSESGGIKQSFAVAEGVTVVGVKQYDMITSSWSWIGGSAQASLETFDTTVLTSDSLDEPRDYTCYTHKENEKYMCLDYLLFLSKKIPLDLLQLCLKVQQIQSLLPILSLKKA